MKKRYAVFGISLLLSLACVVAVGAYQKNAILGPLDLGDGLDPAQVPFVLASDEDLNAQIEIANQIRGTEGPGDTASTDNTDASDLTDPVADGSGAQTVPDAEPENEADNGGVTDAGDLQTPPASESNSASANPLGSGVGAQGSGTGTDSSGQGTTSDTPAPDSQQITPPPAESGGGQTAVDPVVIPPDDPDAKVTAGTSGEFTPVNTVDDSWFDDALFIGDSRTDGLRLYSRISKADYFCNTGLTVFTVLKKSLSDNNFSGKTLSQLLQSKTYGKVLICLGINECGSDLDTIMTAYGNLVNKVRELQPGAKIILQAVMTCGRKKEAQNRCFGPENLYKLNTRIKGLADGVNVFYINSNEVFADSEGYLPDSFSGDGCHLYAKYYPLWVSWIKSAVYNIPVGGSSTATAPEETVPPEENLIPDGETAPEGADTPENPGDVDVGAAGGNTTPDTENLPAPDGQSSQSGEDVENTLPDGAQDSEGGSGTARQDEPAEGQPQT